MAICYLNGEFLPLEQAKVSVLDRGFIFGDGVYEVIPVFNGKLFRLEQHIERLGNSLSAVRIENPLPMAKWVTLFTTLVERNGGGNLSVYVQLTRGVAKRDHVIPGPIMPTVFAMANPISPPPVPQPVAAITLEDLRWQRCDIKAITLLANVLARYEALDEDAYEAILIRQGQVTEGAASNVFVVTQGAIKTPPKSPALLPGITRDLVLEILTANQFPVTEAPVSEAELLQAEEIWLTSSTREILPVTKLNHKPVGSGQAGPVWARVVELYQAYKKGL